MSKKRPSFTRACEFIAREDNPGANLKVDELTSSITVCLVANMWGFQPWEVAARIWSMRNNKQDAFYVGVGGE